MEVTQYFADGTSTDLPSLLIPRKDQSSGSYIRQDGNQANVTQSMYYVFIIFYLIYFYHFTITKGLDVNCCGWIGLFVFL